MTGRSESVIKALRVCVLVYSVIAVDGVMAVDSISEELDDRLKCNRSVGQLL